MIRRWGLICLAVAAAFLAGRYLAPATRTVERTDAKTRTRTVRVVHRAPDGSSVETVRTDTTTERRETKDTQKVAGVSKSDWHVAVFATGLSTDGPYTISVQRRIIGPFSIGLMGSTKLDWGIGIGFSF